jgi:hypothetical protein
VYLPILYIPPGAYTGWATIVEAAIAGTTAIMVVITNALFVCIIDASQLTGADKSIEDVDTHMRTL